MTGAFFWGWLAESGNLKIFNTKSKSKNDLKSTVLTVSRFILFAGIATGLVVSFSSSVIKNVIFQDGYSNSLILYILRTFQEYIRDR
jgi:nucleoid-associated protein YejK